MWARHGGMKPCLRSAANLVRRCKIHRYERSGWDKAARAQFATSEGAKRKAAEFDTGSGEIVDEKVLTKLLKEFAVSGTIKRVAKDYLLTGSTFKRTLKSFEANLLSQNHPELRRTVNNILCGEGQVDDLCTHFLEHARDKNPLVGPALELTLSSDLSKPTDWYPSIRELDRCIYYHAGPTNSGKTHKAIESFKLAKSGIYCAPLRMLAHEVFHRCNDEGVPCDLQTGEELQFASGDEESPAPHLSCTIEMVDLKSHVYDVAVIDEIQMIEDLQRGGAWTRALLGVPAKEVHLCGHRCAIGLVQRLASMMGERFQEYHYQRLVPLVVQKKSLASNYRSVKPGDCVIVFSRREVFETRLRIEAATGQKCAVVYGNLPPTTRVQQAQMFNDPQSHCNIMVATDAVGMGLNLKIKRIVFYSLNKFDGEKMALLSSSHAKQIAGRAGRYGMDHSHGSVTTFHDKDFPLLQELITAPVEITKQAGLSPVLEQIQLFSRHLPHAKLPDILKMFQRMAQVDENYFLCDMDEQMEIASKLCSISMSLADHYYFSKAPVDLKKKSVVSALRQFAQCHAFANPITCDVLKKVLGLKGEPKKALNVNKLAELEEQHEITDVYLWLSMRFPDSFTDEERVSMLQCSLEEAIGESLFSAKLRITDRKRRHLPRKYIHFRKMLYYRAR